jgi:flagellar biosynthesis/type III secretory pathway protein FliH
MSDTAFRRIRVAEALAEEDVFRATASPASSAPADHQPTTQGEPDPYNQGYADGVSAAETVYAEERGRLLGLLRAAQSLQPEASDELANMIAEAVAALVAEIVGGLPVAPEKLLERARACAALVAESDAARAIRVHPDNAPLLQDADLALAILPDPQMPLDALRIDCSAGWIESGTSQYLEALRAQLGLRGASA